MIVVPTNTWQERPAQKLYVKEKQHHSRTKLIKGLAQLY